MYGIDLGLKVFLYFIMEKEWVAAIVYRGPMAKFFSWTISIHGFELYPFERELSDDLG